MEKIKIEKTIYIRDKYKVKRQAFMAGQEVDKFEYDAVLSTNSVVNPQDLPSKPVVVKRSIETKMLEPVTETVINSEEEPVEEKKPKAVLDNLEVKEPDVEKESVKKESPKKDVVKKTTTKKKTED